MFDVIKEENMKILSIEMEPTHYKADLWNAVEELEGVDVSVVFTQSKNWLPDGGHNYLKFPCQNFPNKVYGGGGLFGALNASYGVVANIFKERADGVLICGYSQPQSFFALMACLILGRKFFLFVDEFNTDRPPGKLSLFKWAVRGVLRKLCFNYGQAILVCGRRGIDSARKAGCPEGKIHNFPYSIDVERIERDEPEQIPEGCLLDLESSKSVLFFSGRMIERKGLQTLLSALSRLLSNPEWVLWVEGDGPDLQYYQDMAKELGVEERCRFLGFCQYDLHSWLVRSSTIVVIPSLEDNWAIVVDEGLQLGKPVVSSDATGAGYDRISDRENGFLFPAGDETSLHNLIKDLIEDSAVAMRVGERSRATDYITPRANLMTLASLLRGDLG